jgi:hypothetical protein
MPNRTLKSYPKTQLILATKLLSVFIFMVILFSYFYYFLGNCSGFHEQGVYLDGKASGRLESLYFSLVTITTLGYGDFTPLGASRGVAVIEALAGLFFAGFSISQILSVKQDASIEYLLKSQIVQIYTGYLDNIKDSKERIIDAHRKNKEAGPVDISSLSSYHSNELYPSLIALQKLNGYTKHIKEIEMIESVKDHIDRAATHVEELSSMIKKYINYINDKSNEWKTKQTARALENIADNLDVFLTFVKYSKYENNNNYKNNDSYEKIINNTIKDIRNLIV